MFVCFLMLVLCLQINVHCPWHRWSCQSSYQHWRGTRMQTRLEVMSLIMKIKRCGIPSTWGRPLPHIDLYLSPRKLNCRSGQETLAPKWNLQQTKLFPLYVILEISSLQFVNREILESDISLVWNSLNSSLYFNQNRQIHLSKFDKTV